MKIGELGFQGTEPGPGRGRGIRGVGGGWGGGWGGGGGMMGHSATWGSQHFPEGAWEGMDDLSPLGDKDERPGGRRD